MEKTAVEKFDAALVAYLEAVDLEKLAAGRYGADQIRQWLGSRASKGMPGMEHLVERSLSSPGGTGQRIGNAVESMVRKPGEYSNVPGAMDALPSSLQAKDRQVNAFGQAVQGARKQRGDPLAERNWLTNAESAGHAGSNTNPYTGLPSVGGAGLPLAKVPPEVDPVANAVSEKLRAMFAGTPAYQRR